MKVYIGPYQEEDSRILDNQDDGRDIQIEIHNYDTWSLDSTLAEIIHPALIQLKKDKHGAPRTDNEDVLDVSLWATEEEIKEYESLGKTDSKYFKRWDWILDEMIWAFNEIKQGYPIVEGDGIEYHERIKRGTALFGKYYTSLWD